MFNELFLHIFTGKDGWELLPHAHECLDLAASRHSVQPLVGVESDESISSTFITTTTTTTTTTIPLTSRGGDDERERAPGKCSKTITV